MKSEVRSLKFVRSSHHRWASSALLALAFAPQLHAQFATSVVDYTPGANAGAYTNAATVLGAPSAQTVDPHPVFGGTFPVDPFGSPYLASQIVSLGAGGSLTVGFASPILNRVANPFGLDFLIFGNAGFAITNGNFSGGGITDGSLFGEGVGPWRISVSQDGQTFYALQTSLTPAFDGLYPTDGQGTFGLPVNPALLAANFAGQNLAGIRNLYAGSGGGAGYDLAWARDSLGQPVALPDVSFVRIESLGGAGQIDAFAVAVPEPGALALAVAGAVTLVLWRRWRR